MRGCLSAEVDTSCLSVSAISSVARFHTRAKLDDLLAALTDIHRTDLTRAIDKKLHPEKYKAVDIFAVVEDEDKENQIEEYLMVYVRQIERYDKMRAAGKIRAHPAPAQ